MNKDACVINAYAMPGVKNAYAMPGLVEEKLEDRIFRSVCSVYEVTPYEVRSRGMTRKIPWVTIRQITMALLKYDMKRWTWRKVGEYFGQDHVTAMHSYGVVKNYLETDKSFRKLTETLFEEIEL